MSGRKRVAAKKQKNVKVERTGKSGRPKIIIDAEVADDVHRFAAVGATWEMIASKTGISRDVLQKSELARVAYDLGITDANLSVGGVAFKMATSGKCQEMTKFWLKTRAGWKENQGTLNLNVNTDDKSPSDVIDERLDSLAASMAKRVIDKKET